MPFDTMTVGADGKLTWLFAKGSSAYMGRKRYRATAVVIQDGKILLVKDKHKDDWSMPGGGFKHHENTIKACIREVTKEEIGGLKVLSSERLRQCDFEGQRAKHKVALLTVKGTPYIKAKDELKDEILWWNMKDKIKAQGHVYYILNKLDFIQREENKWG